MSSNVSMTVSTSPMSTESIKETEDLSTAGEASTNEPVVIENNVKFKQYNSGFKSDVNDHSLNAKGDSVLTLSDMIHFTHHPDLMREQCQSLGLKKGENLFYSSGLEQG